MNQSITTHIIPKQLQQDRGYATIGQVILRIKDYRGTYTAGISPEGDPGRKVFEGPLVEELFGWLNSEPIVISAYPIADPRPVLEVAIGDRLEFEGHGILEIIPPNPRYFEHDPKLEVVR